MPGALVFEVDLRRLESTRREIAYVAFANCLSNRKMVDTPAFDFTPIRAQGRRRETGNLGSGKAVKYLLPAGRDVVVSFVNKDDIEVVRREVIEPSGGCPSNELLDVRDHKISAIRVDETRVTIENGGKRAAAVL